VTSKLKRQHHVSVISQTQISSDIFLLELKASELCQQCKPGQFIHIRVSDGIDPFLRRPFSIHQKDEIAGTISILYRSIGKGTKMMQSVSPEHYFNVLGPLGRPFDIKKNLSSSFIVAGGMGIAPVFFLIDALLEKKKSITLLWGARDKSEFFQLNELKNKGVQIHLATDNGSQGHHGLVTDLLRTETQNIKNSFQGFACGPWCMLKEIQYCVKEHASQWQVSMEEHMACGMGVCMGCAVSTVKGYQMVCSDGPIFNLNEIRFHD